MKCNVLNQLHLNCFIPLNVLKALGVRIVWIKLSLPGDTIPDQPEEPEPARTESNWLLYDQERKTFEEVMGDEYEYSVRINLDVLDAFAVHSSDGDKVLVAMIGVLTAVNCAFGRSAVFTSNLDEVIAETFNQLGLAISAFYPSVEMRKIAGAALEELKAAVSEKLGKELKLKVRFSA